MAELPKDDAFGELGLFYLAYKYLLRVNSGAGLSGKGGGV